MITQICKPLRNTLIFLLLWSSVKTSAQQEFYRDEVVNWASLKKPEIPKDLSSYENNDLVIIDDNTTFNFFENNQHVTRDLVIKINSAKGLLELSNFKLPESFDLAYDAHLKAQGRWSKVKTPDTDFLLWKFSARKYVFGQWRQIQFKNRYEQAKRIKATGEFSVEDIMVMQPQDLKPGDIVQIYYEAGFKGTYGTNLFYFYSHYPKLKADYSFIYTVDKYLTDYMFLMPVNIPDSLITKTEEAGGKITTVTQRIRLKDLKAINYPANSYEVKKLPHVYVDMDFLLVMKESYPDNGYRVNVYQAFKPKHFEWIYVKDTSYYYTKIYDKHFAGLRKFVSTLPPLSRDSANLRFFKAFCDTINSFRYLTYNQLFYNQSNLYEVSTIDHLAKRRIVGSPEKLCRDILNDNNILYYRANILDKRFGEHTPYYRVHFAYEWEIIAIPNDKSYLYFLLRPGGVPYLVNELPFYLEGSMASLFPMNLQKEDSLKMDKFNRFIKTHKGTFNSNVRTENATVKVFPEKKEMDISFKESLSGQFSTLLRHLYLNEYIDSTMSPHYFRKCTDKPESSNVRIKLSSKMTDYPFRYTFGCSEKVDMVDEEKLDLSNWFSFTLNSAVLPKAPNHDYFFDFEFSDSYNFLIEFDKPVKIKNLETFRKRTDNAYFELESEIVKNSEQSYLVKVKLLVKQGLIPIQDMPLLMSLVKDLDSLNAFEMEFSAD